MNIPKLTKTQIAILYSIAGFFLFSMGDVARKMVLEDYSPIDVQIWASLASVLFLLVCAPFLGGISSIKKIRKPHIHAIKAVCVTGVMICAIFALDRLSLDVLYTLIFTIPLVTSLVAAMISKEALSLQKLGLVALGFLGVLIAVRPGFSDIDMIGVWMCLMLPFGFAINSVLNKSFDASDAKFPFGMIPYVLCFVVFWAVNGFHMPAMDIWAIGITALAGAASVSGLVLHVYAFQMARADTVAPYQYTQLIWGALLGYLLFGDVPSLCVLSGAVIIIFSGWVIYRSDIRKDDF